jgi:hypothetical protein
MLNKVLISFSSYNAPHFLEHLVTSLENHDAGYDYDLLIWNHSSTDISTLKLLDKYSKKYNVRTRPNYGRAQGGYNATWQYNNNYRYYFFLHDDSGILRDNWLKDAVSRIEDNSVEQDISHLGLDHLSVGKVGFQGYQWQNKYQYLRSGYRTLFYYMDEVADILGVTIPEYYQHLGDDRVLYKNELLQKMGHIWNIEDFRQMAQGITDVFTFQNIHDFFEKRNLLNTSYFAPNDIYGWKYHTFQTVSEFLSDIAPMRYGFRTHIVDGDGNSQEHLGFNSFWGNNYIAHYGDHVVFKRLATVLRTSEEEIRKRFKEKTFLNIADNIIKRETR